MISEKYPKSKIYLNLGNWSLILDLLITQSFPNLNTYVLDLTFKYVSCQYIWWILSSGNLIKPRYCLFILKNVATLWKFLILQSVSPSSFDDMTPALISKSTWLIRHFYEGPAFAQGTAKGQLNVIFEKQINYPAFET